MARIKVKAKTKPKKKTIKQKLKRANRLRGVHGGKGMVALGAGAAGSALWARHHIKKFERDVEKAGGLEEYYDQFRKKGKKLKK